VACPTAQYLEADAAQIEFRLFAHYAGNRQIIEQYAREPRTSFHKLTWEMIKAYKPDMLYTHQKSFNFAGQYGAKSIKLAVMMGFITEEEGNEIRSAKRWDDPRLRLIKEIEAAYARMLPEREPLLARASHLFKGSCDEFCHKNDELHRQYPHRGFVRTLRGRRSRSVNNYKSYIGLNRVLQGTGADIMKLKLAVLHRERKHTGLLMRSTNHDAVLGDARLPETLDRVREVLNEQPYPELRVPIIWECGTGGSWAECK
jgi:DNA polymerase I-like protein with 3'-5' exonuclease and polymerase domains